MTNTILKQSSNLSKRLTSVGFIGLPMLLAWVRLAVWSLQVTKAPYMAFGTRIVSLWKCNGPTFVVHYLKECTRIVQAYVSGNPILVTNMPISIVAGLPSIVPGTLRLKIKSKDLITIRAVLTILSAYRIISIPGKVKLETITSPFKGLSRTLSDYEIRISSGELFSFNKLRLQPMRISFLGAAGPNQSVSMLGIHKDILAWSRSELRPSLANYCLQAPGGKELLLLMASELEKLTKYEYTGKPLILGRLAEKVEAAGKVRVFAITDSITQSVFKPLSDGIFKILKDLPMDGTFDQDKPVRYLLTLHKEGLIDEQTIYSYDLSAATDRLPIDVQVQVLSRLIGTSMATAWKSILCDRDWYYKGKPLKYSVGQPMGALSSWAMLALTHHTLVRVAANRVGFANFTHYALLGDDIVIANEIVAKSYYALMVDVLGVDINLSKSLVSKHSFEFAKRLVTFDGEVSPVGAKNLLVGLKSLKGIPSILLDLVNKGLALSEDSVTNMYKSVPTVRKSQLERISWLVKGPFGFIPTADGLSANIKLTNSLSAVSMDRFLSSIDEAKHRLNLTLWGRNLIKLDELLYNLLSLDTIEGFKGYNPSESPVWNHICDRYYNMGVELGTKRPIRRFIFDGPLVFTNYYRESWKFEMMKYIKSKLSDSSEETVIPLDPFQDERIILPLSHDKKSENFWLLVKDIEEEKRKLTGFRGLV